MKQDEPVDSDDIPFSTEKPLKNAPVPHQMHPLHQKRFSNDFVNDEVSRATKNESNIDSRAFTDDSFNINKPQRSSQKKSTRPVKELSVSMPHNYGEEDEITINKTINDDEDDNDDMEEVANKSMDFDNESPILKTKNTSDFELKLHQDDLKVNKDDLNDSLQRPTTPNKTLLNNFLSDIKEKDESVKEQKTPALTKEESFKDQEYDAEDECPTTELEVSTTKEPKNMSQKCLPRVDMKDPDFIGTPEDYKKKKAEKPKNIEEQTKKLIKEVRKTQIELEKQKSADKSNSISASHSASQSVGQSPDKSDVKSLGKSSCPPNSPDVNVSDKESPHMPMKPAPSVPQKHPDRRGTVVIKEEEFEDSPKEVIRRSMTGSEMHMVPFKKKDLEKKSGVDHKPSSDKLFDIRHTREYEENIEKQHVANHLPMDKVNEISEPLTQKIRRRTYIRSNSDENLLAKPEKIEGKKRRNSVNKKIKKTETGNLMENDFMIKGSGMSYITGALPGSAIKTDKIEE